jgi:hypothetical protein
LSNCKYLQTYRNSMRPSSSGSSSTRSTTLLGLLDPKDEFTTILRNFLKNCNYFFMLNFLPYFTIVYLIFVFMCSDYHLLRPAFVLIKLLFFPCRFACCDF